MKAEYEIGMVGLGVMGRNLLLNMTAKSLPEFLDLLRMPRAVMLLVQAGSPIDAVIHDLLPYLARGDLIIDGGNSHFSDTELRTTKLAERGIQFQAVGISGGEHGLRTVDIQAKRPEWQLSRDGCPGGESPTQIGKRADHTVSRLRECNGKMLIFSSGHFLRVLAARWLGLEPVARRFLC